MKKPTLGEIITIATILAATSTSVAVMKTDSGHLASEVKRLERTTATREGVDALASRLERVENMLINGGISERLATNIKSAEELRGEIDEMWKVLNLKDPAERLGELHGRLSAVERQLGGGP